jgi:hypothetical protein
VKELKTASFSLVLSCFGGARYPPDEPSSEVFFNLDKPSSELESGLWYLLVGTYVS